MWKCLASLGTKKMEKSHSELPHAPIKISTIYKPVKSKDTK